MKPFFSARRNARLLPLILAGCYSGPSGSCNVPDLDLTNSGLGNGNFEYACPATSGQDAWCDVNNVTGQTTNVPTVATGASFSIAYYDNEYENIVPVPAVPSLTTPASTTRGGDATSYASAPVALNGPGSYAFLAYEPGAALPVLRDFINVQSAAAADLVLSPSPATLYLAESPQTVNVAPLDSGGNTLAGELTCAFTSSNPSVLTAMPSGRAAILTAHAVGKSVLTVACLGVTTKVTVDVLAAAPDGGDDAGRDAAPEDAASDATKEDAADAGPPADDDAATDAESDAEPDATAFDADADGGE